MFHSISSMVRLKTLTSPSIAGFSGDTASVITRFGTCAKAGFIWSSG